MHKSRSVHSGLICHINHLICISIDAYLIDVNLAWDRRLGKNKSTNQVAQSIANKMLVIEYSYIPVHIGEINVQMTVT